MFKVISIFATLALAGFASATPLSDIKGLVAAPAVPALAIPRAVDVPTLPTVDTKEVPKVELPEVEAPGKREVPASLEEVLSTLIAGLEPILDDLKGTVTVKADIDLTHVVDLLGKVVVLLDGTLATVKALPAEALVVALPVVAALLKTVLFLVATILSLVLGLGSIVSATALTHVETIKTLVGALLAEVLALVPGLLAVVVALVGDLVQLLVHLNIASVLTVLGLAL